MEADTQTHPPSSSLSFEEALKQLETIVQKMEAGGLGLEESIKLYQEGVDLKQFCEKQLQAATLKVEKINLSTNSLEPTSFSGSEDA